MPVAHLRIMTVVEEELAQWLRWRSRAEGLVVREILAQRYVEDEERLWAKEGEERFRTFDRKTALSHEDAWP
jgi:hypothetical protein